jgi:hypothetical protein
MIYEFAVSPSICDNWQNLRFLLSSFGKVEGRLLSDIPKKQWFNLALKTIKQSDHPPVERKRLSEGIIKLKNKSLYKRNYVPECAGKNWMEHALTAHKDRPFRAILTDGCHANVNCVLINDIELIEKDLWNIQPGCMAKRTAAEMLEPIKPMLDCANEVILIDRNFNPGKARFVNFLAELLTYLSHRSYSPSIQTIAYHLGDKIPTEHIQYLCNEHVTRRIPNGMKLNIYIWPKDELHDRYVLTDNGGVKYGVGLDEYDGSGSKEVAINRIFESEYRKWWTDCQKRQPAFNISHKS